MPRKALATTHGTRPEKADSISTPAPRCLVLASRGGATGPNVRILVAELERSSVGRPEKAGAPTRGGGAGSGSWRGEGLARGPALALALLVTRTRTLTPTEPLILIPMLKIQVETQTQTNSPQALRDSAPQPLALECVESAGRGASRAGDVSPELGRVRLAVHRIDRGALHSLAYLPPVLKMLVPPTGRDHRSYHPSVPPVGATHAREQIRNVKESEKKKVRGE